MKHLVYAVVIGVGFIMAATACTVVFVCIIPLACQLLGIGVGE